MPLLAAERLRQRAITHRCRAFARRAGRRRSAAARGRQPGRQVRRLVAQIVGQRDRHVTEHHQLAGPRVQPGDQVRAPAIGRVDGNHHVLVGGFVVATLLLSHWWRGQVFAPALGPGDASQPRVIVGGRLQRRRVRDRGAILRRSSLRHQPRAWFIGPTEPAHHHDQRDRRKPVLDRARGGMRGNGPACTRGGNPASCRDRGHRARRYSSWPCRSWSSCTPASPLLDRHREPSSAFVVIQLAWHSTVTSFSEARSMCSYFCLRPPSCSSSCRSAGRAQAPGSTMQSREPFSPQSSARAISPATCDRRPVKALIPLAVVPAVLLGIEDQGRISHLLGPPR